VTNQALRHILRESERIRLEQARLDERNTVRVRYALATVVLTATDYAGRTVPVALTDCAVDQLIADLLEAKRCRKHVELNDDAPQTKRDGSASTWPPPEERVDEIRGAT
jgi:hypothetical protein